MSTPDAQKLARQSGAHGIVLLKNDANLPLRLNRGLMAAIIGLWEMQTGECKADTVVIFRIYILPFT